VVPIESLIQAAAKARLTAYAPYSGYAVGAAVESTAGNVYGGGNVENVSFPAGICAERNAITSMVAGGDREIAQIAVVTEGGGMPCGICLQVIAEFAPDPAKVLIHIGDAKGYLLTKSLVELMPFRFDAKTIKRTEP